MTQSTGTNRTPIAAAFQTKDDARNAAKALKDANFEHVWIGVTEIADEHDHDHHGHEHGHKAHGGATWNPFSPTYGDSPEEAQTEKSELKTTRGNVSQRSQGEVESVHDVKGEGGVGRLFGKGGSGLVDQLTERGFNQSLAQQIDRDIPDGATILTAEGDASSASSILSQYNGRLLTNAISPNYRGWSSTTTGSTQTTSANNRGYDEDVFTTRSRNVTTGTVDVGDSQSARRI